MRYEILFSPEAVQDIKKLSARDRSTIRDSMERHLRFEPEKVSRSRIKLLRGIYKPQYRLRVVEFRIFYDVSEGQVSVLAIVSKQKASEWLKQYGEKQ